MREWRRVTQGIVYFNTMQLDSENLVEKPQLVSKFE